MLNTNSIITTIQNDIQKAIDLEQKKLDNIKNSFAKAEQFLLDNGTEICDDDDVLIEIMKCIKNMKQQMSDNNLDIKNISNSIKSLEALSNTIDPSITESLKDKIKTIESYNSTSKEKLNEARSFLEVLLSLEIVCPACQGGTRATQRKNSGNCSYCAGRGVLNISTLLEKEGMLEVDYVKTNAHNSYNNYGYVPDYNIPLEENSSNNKKFVITTK